jgi:hypothetical protein
MVLLLLLSINGHNLARVGNNSDRGFAGVLAADAEREDGADPDADPEAFYDPETDADYDTLEEARGLTEKERVAGFYARGYTWPPKEDSYSPNTPGWKRLMKDRILQIERDLPGDTDKKYEAYIQASLLVL